MSEQSKPRKAIVYTRLSASDDELSLADQDSQCRQLAARLGWTVARTATEAKTSAWKRRKVKAPDPTAPDGERWTWVVVRPVWSQIMTQLETGEADGLLVVDRDRACRQPTDLERLVDVHLASGAPVESVTDSIHLRGSDSDITMARIMVAIAWQESADKARRVKAARKRQAEAGTWGGGVRPYGFTPTDTPGVLDKEAAEVQVMDDMDRDVVAGRTLWAIAHDLNEREVPTVKGGQWTPESVRSIILRERTGDVVSDRATWQAAVEILRNPARRLSPGNKAQHLLSGILRCGVCGGPLVVQRCRGVYVCRASHVKIAQGHTEREVTATIITRLALPDAARLLAAPDGTGADVAALASEAAKLRQRKTMLAGLLAADEMDEDEWRTASKVVKDKLATLEAKLTAAAEHAPSAPAATLAGREDAAALWQALDLEAKRAVIRSLVTITVNRQGRGGRPPGWKSGESYFDPRRIAIHWRSEPVSACEAPDAAQAAVA
jgi:DNA invertase Pin-like site-specific DNA recombinase